MARFGGSFSALLRPALAAPKISPWKETAWIDRYGSNSQPLNLKKKNTRPRVKTSHRTGLTVRRRSMPRSPLETKTPLFGGENCCTSSHSACAYFCGFSFLPRNVHSSLSVMCREPTMGQTISYFVYTPELVLFRRIGGALKSRREESLSWHPVRIDRRDLDTWFNHRSFRSGRDSTKTRGRQRTDVGTRETSDIPLEGIRKSVPGLFTVHERDNLEGN